MTVPRFWREQPQRYRLIGDECSNCGSIYFPPRQVCPKCRRESIGKMVPRQLSGRGEVLTHTVVHQPADGFELQVPYVMAIIDLEEGCRVMSQVVDCEPNALKPGLAVEATFRRIREDGKSGVIYYGFKFRVARTRRVEPKKTAAEQRPSPLRAGLRRPASGRRG